MNPKLVPMLHHLCVNVGSECEWFFNFEMMLHFHLCFNVPEWVNVTSIIKGFEKSNRPERCYANASPSPFKATDRIKSKPSWIEVT